jgi:hypothetical protein
MIQSKTSENILNEINSRNSTISNNNYYNDNNNNISDNKCNLRLCLIEPLLLFGGIFFNLCFIYIILRRKRTSKLKSNKPFRFIFITILICDIWYLIEHINIWYHSLVNKSDLTSINGICQFHSYFSNFFTFLNEIQMLIGGFLLIRIVSSTTNTSSDIYHSFIENSTRDDSTTAKSSVDFGPEELEKRHIKLNYPRQNNQNNKNIKFQINSDHEKNCDMKSRWSKSGFKIMINVLDHFRNKKETLYYDMLLKEKFVTWLSVFLCMYMLSFTLWIKVINIDSDEFLQTCKTSILLKQIFSNLTNPTATNSKMLSTCPPVPVICIIHDSFRSFHKIFQLILSVLCSFTLFINLWSSVYFFIKFRYQYLRSIYTKFKYSDVTYNFKHLNFLTCCHLIYPSNLFGNNDYVDKINEFDREKYLKYDEEVKTFLTNTSLTTTSTQLIVPYDQMINQKESCQRNSLVRPAVSNFEKRKHQLLLQSNYDHFHFVRHYALNVFIYSLLISPSVFRSTCRNLNDVDFSSLLQKITANSLNKIQNGTINTMSTHLYDSKRFQDILNVNKPISRNVNTRQIKKPSSTISAITGITPTLPSSVSILNNSSKVLIYDKHKAKSLLDLINDPNEIKVNEKNQLISDEFLYVTELMAHSVKFLVYIMFSANIKFYFRFV